MSKIKVLFLAADPNSGSQRSLDLEARTIRERIRSAEFRDSLEFVTRWAVRPDDLLQALNEQQPHVVQFSSPGEAAGRILLEDDAGRAHPVSGETLANLFRVMHDNVRLVVFNACYSADHAVAVTRHVDCAIGMSSRLPDGLAVDFAASLYRAIGFGRSVGNAFEQGLVSLQLKNIAGDELPQLQHRSGVDPARVVLVEPAAANQPAVQAVAPGGALEIWREKLAFLLREQAVAANAAQQFELQQRIAEARAKIAELTGGADR